MRVTLPDDSATEEMGRKLARHAKPGDVLLLEGPLGAGKSTLARAFIRERVGDPRLAVPSPSFTLAQTYEAPDGTEIWHYDLWRLNGPDALHELGWDEAQSGIVLVEWPDRLGPLAPRHAWRLALSHDKAGRVIDLAGDLRGFDAS